MDHWKDIKNEEKQSNVIACMESLRPALYQLISRADADIQSFDYYVDAFMDHEIVLLDDGWNFAAANTDGFNNPVDLMMWVMQALNEYYYDYYEEDDPITIDYTSIKKGGRR